MNFGIVFLFLGVFCSTVVDQCIWLSLVVGGRVQLTGYESPIESKARRAGSTHLLGIDPIFSNDKRNAMPPTSAIETVLLTKVLTHRQTLNNTSGNSPTDKMCLSSPSSSTSAVCRRASCNSLDQNSTDTCTTSNNCDLRHRKHASLSAITTNAIKPTKVLDDKLDLSEDEKNDVYKECATKSASTSCNASAKAEEVSEEFKSQIRWPDLMAQVFIHVGAVYGLYLLFFAKFYTFIWAVVTIWATGVGITAGAHRLWSHKSYTAAMPLRLLLIFLFTIAGQRDAYTWALDHRIHHKFSETEADPHNAKRGFFFAHVGWLFLTPHPKVEEKRKVIDMSDLENDRVVMFQRKWYIPLFATFAIALPVLVPWYYWNEDLWMSFWINFNMRFCSTLNIAFFVNSVAHMWGKKPYDKNISPVECPVVSFLALGEGWHNYHHVFPWDYKTSELGDYSLNVTTAFLDFCAKLGWVTGRKSVSPDMVARRAAKCGDGSHFLSDEYAHKDQVWGYGDRDLPKEDAAELETMKE